MLTASIVEIKRDMISSNTWDDKLEWGYGFLKSKLDPLHTYELKGYFAKFPFLVAAGYLVATASQVVFRDFFPVVYGLCVAGVVLPGLIALF